MLSALPTQTVNAIRSKLLYVMGFTGLAAMDAVLEDAPASAQPRTAWQTLANFLATEAREAEESDRNRAIAASAGVKVPALAAVQQAKVASPAAPKRPLNPIANLEETALMMTTLVIVIARGTEPLAEGEDGEKMGQLIESVRNLISQISASELLKAYPLAAVNARARAALLYSLNAAVGGFAGIPPTTANAARNPPAAVLKAQTEIDRVIPVLIALMKRFMIDAATNAYMHSVYPQKSKQVTAYRFTAIDLSTTIASIGKEVGDIKQALALEKIMRESLLEYKAARALKKKQAADVKTAAANAEAADENAEDDADGSEEAEDEAEEDAEEDA